MKDAKEFDNKILLEGLTQGLQKLKASEWIYGF